MGKRPNDSSVANLFTGNGEVKRKVKLNSFFTRRPYQYTPAEVYDESFEKRREERDEDY